MKIYQLINYVTILIGSITCISCEVKTEVVEVTEFEDPLINVKKILVSLDEGKTLEDFLSLIKNKEQKLWVKEKKFYMLNPALDIELNEVAFFCRNKGGLIEIHCKRLNGGVFEVIQQKKMATVISTNGKKTPSSPKSK